MTPFLFARGLDLDGATVRLTDASFRGPTELVENGGGGERFTLLWGDRDAAYSRLSYDAATGAVEIETDAAGQLALRYAFVDGVLFVASHDLELAPHVPFAVDEASLHHVRRVGWSVGGASLIRGIATCPPGTRVTLSDRVRTEATALPDAGDPVAACLDFLAPRLGPGRVLVELSAGFDSRAALAATIACKGVDGVQVFSEGPEDSQDVQVAQEICRRHGVRFERRDTAPRAPDAVLADWSDAAAANNGHLEVDVLASWERGRPQTVCGDGGEIHRGNYYPYRPFQSLRGPFPDVAEAALARRFGRSARLDTVVDRLRRAAASEAEVLDRFYVTERFGVWNQKLARGGDRRISPFYSRRAMGGLGRGLDCALHVALIRDHLPRAADIPINGEAPPSLYGGGRLTALRRDGRLFAGKIARRLRPGASLQDSRATVMAEVLRRVPPDFLHAPADGWAELGAQRFLRMYRDAADRARAAARPRPHASDRSDQVPAAGA